MNKTTHFSFVWLLPKMYSTPTVYTKNLDNEPDIVPFAYSTSQFWHVIQRTHSIMSIGPRALKLFPASGLDNNLFVHTHGKTFNVDLFANKLGAADGAIIPDNKTNSYTFQRAGIFISNHGLKVKKFLI